MRKLKILITAIGITGKSQLRRKLMKSLRNFGLSAIHYDADEFKELRNSADADCLKKLPESFSEKIVYVIEDIHASIPKEAVLSLNDYDLILYIKTGILSHFLFWFPRMISWFNQGQFSWEAKTGWRGTGKPKDWRNILPIIKTLIRDFRNRKKWIKEDMHEINSYPHIVIQSYWSTKGPKFRLDI